MSSKTIHRIYLNVLLFVTAAVLCTLPFLLLPQEEVFIYTKGVYPDSRERGFVRELQNLGYKVITNKTPSALKEVAIWFRTPSQVKDIMHNNHFTYNFLYTEEYYPLEWKGETSFPIVLTPYLELYEHYMRSNIKSATFYLGVNTEEFTNLSQKKAYPLVYYEQRNFNTPLAQYLNQLNIARFLGRFWSNGLSPNATSKDISQKENEILSKAYGVIVDTEQNEKLIPEELIRATLTGAIVMAKKTDAIYDMYNQSIVYYDNNEDISNLLSYYQKHDELSLNKIKQASMITINNLSSKASAKRFDELLSWLKKNDY